MVRGMISSPPTGFSGCGGIAGGIAAEAWRSTTQGMLCTNGAKMAIYPGLMGPQLQAQYGMDGPNSAPRREFGFGRGGAGGGIGGCSGMELARRGGADFLWLLARASAGDGAGYNDGGCDFASSSGGVGGGGGGNGRGGDSGSGGHRGRPGGGGGGGGGDASFFPHAGAALWLWYNSLLETHPLVSKSLTAGLMNAFADLFCQVFIEKLDEIDWKRLLSFMSIGLFLSGPGLHFWYGALPRIITMSGLGGVLLRIALDQLIFTPLGMITFFVVLLTLEDRRDDIRAKLEKDWWPTVVANWKVWIPFQIVNFGFIPPQLQVAAAGLLGMVWSVFISYKGHT